MGKTLEQLREMVRRRADVVGNPAFDDDALEDYINVGWQALYALLVGTYEDFVVEHTDTAIVSGQADYSLDVTPRPEKLRGVSLKIEGGDRFVPLKRGKWNERGYDAPGSGITGTLRVHYIPTVPPIVDVKPAAEWVDPLVPEPETGAADDAIAEIPKYVTPEWTELIVLEAALYVAQQEEGIAGNMAILKALRDEKKAAVRAGAPDRDAEQPHQAIDRSDDFSDAIASRRSRATGGTTRYILQGMTVTLFPTP